jgi:hypothetical protein
MQHNGLTTYYFLFLPPFSFFPFLLPTFSPSFYFHDYDFLRHANWRRRRRWRTPAAPRLHAAIKPHIPHPSLRHVAEHVVTVAQLAHKLFLFGLGLGIELLGELQSEV